MRADADAASVNDDSADAQRRLHFGKQSGSRHTRSKHPCDEPLLHPAPKQKRSRYAHVYVDLGKQSGICHTRSKHPCDDSLQHPAPTQKRSRCFDYLHILACT